jgi:hypothetical protein
MVAADPEMRSHCSAPADAKHPSALTMKAS